MDKWFFFILYQYHRLLQNVSSKQAFSFLSSFFLSDTHIHPPTSSQKRKNFSKTRLWAKARETDRQTNANDKLLNTKKV